MARILVVDDELDLNNLVRDQLQAQGHHVVQAFDGGAAVAAVEAEVPDLVILDWMLPDLDGLAVCRRLRENHVMPIIMLTARGEAQANALAELFRPVRFDRAITSGPFSATTELVSGFWLIQVKSLDEAIEWMKRAPFDGGAEIEIRQVFDAEDFGEALTPELREQEQRLRAQAKK